MGIDTAGTGGTAPGDSAGPPGSSDDRLISLPGRSPVLDAAQLEARASHDVWDRLGAVTCPALVGYGTYDGIAPVHNSTAIASRIRGAELRGYEGGHLFLVQDPVALPEFEAFLQAPGDLSEQVRAGPGGGDTG